MAAYCRQSSVLLSLLLKLLLLSLSVLSPTDAYTSSSVYCSNFKPLVSAKALTTTPPCSNTGTVLNAGNMRITDVITSCSPKNPLSTALVKLIFPLITNNNAHRCNVGFWVGQSATSDPSLGKDLCTALTPSGAADNAISVDGDKCGDIKPAQNSWVSNNGTAVNVPCRPDAKGNVLLNICVGYSLNCDSGLACTNPNDARPLKRDQCNCLQLVPVPGLFPRLSVGQKFELPGGSCAGGPLVVKGTIVINNTGYDATQVTIQSFIPTPFNNIVTVAKEWASNCYYDPDQQLFLCNDLTVSDSVAVHFTLETNSTVSARAGSYEVQTVVDAFEIVSAITVQDSFAISTCGTACPVWRTTGACKSCADAAADLIRGTFSPQVAQMRSAISVNRVSSCCDTCASTLGCAYYTFDNSTKPPKCFFYGPASCNQQTFNKSANGFTGGKCNPSVSDDPHFVGAHGVRFDFNGVPDKTFCLLTDKAIHINMLLSGYYDQRVSGASKVIRSWIRELVFFWRAADQTHTLHLVARSGASSERGAGFMESISFDGQPLPRFRLGDTVTDLKSGLAISLASYETLGPYQVDLYHLSIQGLLFAELRLRVAHPKLQIAGNAQVHLNMKLVDINVSKDVHGVLGQTFRKDRTDRTFKFQRIVDSLNRPIQADGVSGRGFLDGEMVDYETSGPMFTACKYDRFDGLASALQTS